MQKSLKTPADNADNTAISCAARCDELPVSGRDTDAVNTCLHIQTITQIGECFGDIDLICWQ